ncbi:LuxR family transcriptional regulator [Mycobacterium shinjukuense]|uniref:Helix-turn-helix transcriptional regulator n=1 Tax=Mycobacterium shinjukuense TaxID=398694 RepID=A0A7I7MSJ2_9MYCO|nr:isoniazid response ATPase/transcriptional regulator IniR [Mycobacterium shinjukuense]MCV6986268.1 LuxR family transcriptional regulator [Mycobacterium shinjukuense]ORB63053.1 helix-turn-helix transcriptional regulator [Mycobacterium shinjukuense]BBX75234.1 helix-turn-helix transcriptional regulator [Mycobacterium shinjukuense]
MRYEHVARLAEDGDPVTASASELPPAARGVIRDLMNAATLPVKVLISGGLGTGKSTVLAAARETLRRAGLNVLARPPRDGDPLDAAFVVDDAHLLSDAELLQLTERVADARATVVVAAEAHEQHPALRALATAVERDRPRISLGPLPVAEHLRDCTAGLPFLVHAVSDGSRPSAQAAKTALIERLRRLDEPALDTLLVMSLTPELGTTDVAAALGISATDARRLVDRAHASGLTGPAHPPAFLRSVHEAVAHIVGNAHHNEVETSLLRSQLDIATVSPELALRLAEHGLRDDRLAGILARYAADARADSVRAARLYRAAVGAGAEGLTSRLADALALTGDCAAAATLADDLLTSSDSADRAAAVRIAASVATHDGNTGQAAELFGWLGPHSDPVVGAAAAIVFAATGDQASARAALRLNDAGPPTMAARAARGLAEGLLLSIDQPYPAAMARLGQALAVGQSIGEVLPDSPAALVTLAAIHGGDPVRARGVIGRAVHAGGDALFRGRHLLLSGWIKMQDGQLPSATADVTAAGAELHRRDALWAAALRTAVARRSGDIGALQKHWCAARDVLAEHSVDLFTLLPVGELWVAAARLRQLDQLQHTVDQAFTLLDSLGNPTLWSIPLHWAGVHAGILANSPESVAPHGQALSAAAGHSTLARALAGAGRTWLRVLADRVDADEVTAAARALSRAGLTSDATRLAGQAALQTPDARVSGAMLQLARDLKLSVSPSGTPSEPADAQPPTTGPSAARQPRPGTPLSDREREVAELLLLGMPYRDIGGQLFISAKTVEHHVARIRRRLGAGSRSEMLSMLRAMLAPPGESRS